MDGQWKLRFVGAGQGEAGEANVDNGGALRVSLRPTEAYSPFDNVYGGHYQSAYKTGALNGGGAGTTAFFSFRWGDSRRSCLINRVTVAATTITASTTNMLTVAPTMWMVRNFTAGDSGGTGSFITLREWPKRTGSISMVGGERGTSGEIRVANTSTLTTGTGSPDNNPIATTTIPLNTLAVGSMTANVDLLGTKPGLEHGVLLAKNEGFRVGVLTALGTGTYNFYYTVDWTELPLY